MALPASSRARTAAAAMAACLGGGSLLLTAGCAAAPAGAIGSSPAIGPTVGASPTNFPPFQVPATWSGYRSIAYEQVQKAVAGTKPRNFHITAGPDLVFWLGCLGTGEAKLKSAALGLSWEIQCSSRLDPQAISFSPTTQIADGTAVKVLVTVTKGAIWEVRIDAPRPPGT